MMMDDIVQGTIDWIGWWMVESPPPIKSNPPSFLRSISKEKPF